MVTPRASILVALALASAAPASAATHTLYVAFDGAAIQGGMCSSAADGCSSLDACSGTTMFPAHPGGAIERDMIAALLRQWFAPFDVEVVTARPAAGPYTMVLVGGSAADLCVSAPRAMSLGPTDCGNANDGDVVFAFSRVVPDVMWLSAAIAAAVGGSYGLERTGERRDLMFGPLVSPPDPDGFLDEEAPIVDSAGGAATSACAPGATSQNAHRRLLAVLGPGAPDTTAPTASITLPLADAVVPARQPLTVRFAVQDDFPRYGLHDAAVVVDRGLGGERRLDAPRRPYEVVVPGDALGDGPHTLEAVVTDGAGNVGTSAVLRITAGGGAAGGGGAGAGGGEAGLGGAAGSAGAGGAAGSAGAGGAGSGAASRGSSGGCTTAGAGRGAFPALLLLLAPVMRRVRRAAPDRRALRPAPPRASAGAPRPR